MKNTLLEKCNADVFKAILDIKAEKPDAGQELINTLQKHEYWWQMTGNDILNISAHLPYGELWNNKIHTFYLLFQSQQTTTMP
jgi:hypothetical protein